MATTYTQAGRPFAIRTPLGKDAMLAVGLHGTEALSQPFHYSVDVKTTRTQKVPFEALMGQPVGLDLEVAKGLRHFHGICVRITQGESDVDFTDYRLDLVPKVWLLSKRSQSRIFQQITVPDILKKVLAGFDVEYQLTGTFEPRDYCAQYRESDFDFASRLMEEEGIFYFFRQDPSKHTMVLANSPQAHPAVPGPSRITYRAVNQEGALFEDNITEFTKTQEQTSGKFTLWDHTFELPHENLMSVKPIADSVAFGKVAHKLGVENSTLEVYDWPGEYSQRFDGIDPGGGERPADLQKIFQDNKRTVDLRMQQAAATAVVAKGTGTARQMKAGHKFTLAPLATDPAVTPLQADGDYVLTSVTHSIHVPATYRSGSQSGTGFRYSNTFTALPAGLPFRPQRVTPKPLVSGSQSAVVVGPPGEEIFTDKYGRIKVQFHWDREGKRNADSSCWLRVAQLSAGRNWGSFALPRVGQEVLVDFLEGDPDQPICIGCVYNPDQMPLYQLPKEKTKSYIRTNTSPGGVGYNEIRFEDKKDGEQVYVHAQKNMDARVRFDSKERVGNNRHLRTGFYLANDHKGDASGETKQGSQFEEVAVDQHLKVHRHQVEQIGGNWEFLVGDGDGPGNADVNIRKDLKEDVGGAAHLTIASDRNEKVGGSVSLDVGASQDVKVGASHALDAGQSIHLKAGMTVVIEAGMGLTIKAGGNFITINAAGVQISGTMVLINSGGSALSGAGAKPTAPEKPKVAKPTKPLDSDLSITGAKSN